MSDPESVLKGAGSPGVRSPAERRLASWRDVREEMEVSLAAQDEHGVPGAVAGARASGQFYYVPWRTELAHGEEYRTADLPDDVPCDWLASQGPDFGLYEVMVDPSRAAALRVEPVGPELAILLHSARDYPPALALARERLLRLELDLSDRDTFEREYGSSLRALLDAQPTSPFFLARSRVERFGWFSKDTLVWIVCRDVTGRQVGWVTYDHWVYFCTSDAFDIEQAQMDRLPVVAIEQR